MFPVVDLTERLQQLDNNPREFDDVYTGELVMNTKGEVEFRPGGQPIRNFLIKTIRLRVLWKYFSCLKLIGIQVNPSTVGIYLDVTLMMMMPPTLCH